MIVAIERGPSEGCEERAFLMTQAMDSDDSGDVVGDSFGSRVAGVVGRVVLCGVVGRRATRFRRVNRASPIASHSESHPGLYYHSLRVARILEERVDNVADEGDQVLLGIGVFRSFALLASQQTQWHSNECMAMYSALVTKITEPTMPGAVLMPVVVAAEFSNPIPFPPGERAWWHAADWREIMMMDGVTTVLCWWARPYSTQCSGSDRRGDVGCPGGWADVLAFVCVYPEQLFCRLPSGWGATLGLGQVLGLPHWIDPIRVLRPDCWPVADGLRVGVPRAGPRKHLLSGPMSRGPVGAGRSSFRPDV